MPSRLIRRPSRRLRLLTCGSVDDGKSTLIGRMLYEKKLIFDDQLSTLERDSKKFGTTGEDDRLTRSWSTGSRPNASKASRSTSPIAISPPKGARSSSPTRPAMSNSPATWRLAPPTPTSRSCWSTRAKGCSRRPIAIRSSFRCLACAMSCLRSTRSTSSTISETVFRQIEADYRKFAEPLGFRSLIALPISARHGDNVSSLSARTPWYAGPHLLDYLEGVEVEEDRRSAPFRLPVQWINRPHLDFRGFAGTIPERTRGARRSRRRRRFRP